MDLKEIVEIHNNELRAGTWFIAQGFEREHKEVTKLIEKYLSKFETLGELTPRKLKSTGGRPVTEFLLNEPQATFLGTLFRNQNDKVVDFKLKLVKRFYQMKRALENVRAQHKDVIWLKNREEGKAARLGATDEIKEFKIYAIEQGSDNADWYYTSLTKMLNGLLFIVDGKFKNLRDMMTPIQLLIVAGGDLVIKKALQDGMKKQLFYKEIYKLAKERVETFAELYGQSKILSQQLAIEWQDE